MSGHLLLASLGPVQDFIASARRCQDLWYGSWLLSEVSRATASEIERRAGREALVFPGALGNDKAAIANKILAHLSDASPAEVASDAKRAMQDRLREIAEQAFSRLPASGWDRDRAMSQVDDLMEFLWVAVPVDESAGYGPARRRAEQLLAERKNTRTWGPVPWEPPPGIPKSSLDGQRESVLDEHLFDDVRKGRRDAEWLRRNYFVKPAERLCGVGLLKRLGEESAAEGAGRYRPPFHSTSHLASAPLLVRARREEAAPAMKAFAGTLEQVLELDRFRIRPGDREAAVARSPFGPDVHVDYARTHMQEDGRGLDGYLLFEDRLKDAFEESGANEAGLERARNALRTLLGHLGAPGGPSPYYGILLADGDRMGRAINHLAETSPADALDRHRRLSSDLDAFALGARELVEEHGGSLVYAGGDDVLALVPLHTALTCARSLERRFAEAMAASSVGLPEDARPTLSVGLAVAHHMDPMGGALALARRAERLAKVERNSLAVLVDKRSGSELTVTGPWDAASPLDRRLATWCRLLHEEALPDGVAWHLEEAIAPFELRGDASAEPARSSDDLADVVQSLVRRVFLRRRAEGGATAIRDDVRTLLETALGEARTAEHDVLDRVRSLSHEIQVARVFLAAYELAWGNE